MRGVARLVLGAAVLAAVLGPILACSDDGGQSSGGDGSYLRASLGLDLATVQSLAYIPAQQATGKALTDAARFAVFPSGLTTSGLFATTMAGTAVPLPLLEGADGSLLGVVQPQIAAIFAVKAWLVLQTQGLSVQVHGSAAAEAPLACPAIFVRRSDGALFCSSVGLSSTGDNYGNVDALRRPLQDGVDGQIAYFVTRDSIGRNVLYRLVADSDGLPSATLVTPALHPTFFVVNARGDVLVREFDEGARVAKVTIVPAGGGSPFLVQGTSNSYAVAGARGTAFADTFYVVGGGSDGVAFDGTIRVVRPAGPGFEEQDLVVPLPVEMLNCSGLFPVQGGDVMLCSAGESKTVLRVLVDGALSPTPTSTPLPDIGGWASVGGLPFRYGAGRLFVAGGPPGARVVLRYDGSTFDNVPLPPNLGLLAMIVSGEGALDLLGIDDDDGTLVRATLPPDAQTVTVLSVEGIEVANAVVFTRLQ